MAAGFLSQLWLGPVTFPLLVTLIVLTLYSILVGVIVGAILYGRRLFREMGEYAAELGNVLLEQRNLRIGLGWVIRPADAQLERVEVSRVFAGRNLLTWRMLVDSFQGSNLSFEMWRKPMPVGGGRVFAPGEAVIGVGELDRRFWIETAMPKRVAALLSDSDVYRMLAVAENKGLQYLRVAGSRIELQFGRERVENARAMFGLAHLLSHRMAEFA